MQTILGADETIGKLLAKELMSYTDRVRLVSRNPIRVNETDELHPADLRNRTEVAREVSSVCPPSFGMIYEMSA